MEAKSRQAEMVPVEKEQVKKSDTKKAFEERSDAASKKRNDASHAQHRGRFLSSLHG